jgi:hypothetical protein
MAILTVSCEDCEKVMSYDDATYVHDGQYLCKICNYKRKISEVEVEILFLNDRHKKALKELEIKKEKTEFLLKELEVLTMDDLEV